MRYRLRGKGIMHDYRYHYTNRCMTIKRLSKVWRSSKYHNIKKHNTLIVDDNPDTYQFNYGNAIPIPTFEGNIDDVLLNKLSSYLNDLIESFSNMGDPTFRHVEKRNWYLNY